MRALGFKTTLRGFFCPRTCTASAASLATIFLALVAACDSPPPVEPETARVSPSPTRPRVEPVEPPAEPERRVLVTIDDLPLAMRGDYRNDEERRETVRRLVTVLREEEVPVVGFFNMKDHASDPSLATTWLELDGFVAGNHTWSHPSARRVKTERFLEEIRLGHEAVSELVADQEVVPFRFPYLNQGFDVTTRRESFATLDELESPHVPVTINTSDWLYAKGYLAALHDDDDVAADRWKQAWLWNIQESTMTAEFWADQLFGRQPPQILLLHANRLNADHLSEALDWYRERDYRFVGLDEVLQDSAYEETDVSLSPIGEPHWLRLRRSRTLGAEEADEADEELAEDLSHDF